MADRLIINSGGSRNKTGNDSFSDSVDQRTDNAILEEKLQEALQKAGQDKAGRADRDTKAGRTDRDTRAGTASKTSTPEHDEMVWGNDRTFMDKIDEEQRADLRLFVRIRYMQKVTCSTVYEDITNEPYELDKPLELMIVDISVGGIGVICESEIDVGRILGIHIVLDTIPYDVKCEVIYCIPIDGKFRVGLKIAHKTKSFMRHLKIFIARIALTSAYASGE